MTRIREHMELYRAEHRTVGCKVTHLVGVPMIAASFPMLLFNWRWAVGMFVTGWILQFSGHHFFEHNQPVLVADPANPLTYFAALIFVGEEWARLLAGRGLGVAPRPGSTD
ncbi:MAG TPA: DUF962 domain-containing protein [Blastocatellia bacterium]|nr:DUF962 domain-containing protein [Blastocatellia bacterium]